jgi:hypothetical protein
MKIGAALPGLATDPTPIWRPSIVADLGSFDDEQGKSGA